MSNASAPHSSRPPVIHVTFRRAIALGTGALLLGIAYVLRGVIVPLFFAFLLAYALDPFVDLLEARKVPRTLAAPLVMLGIAGVLGLVLMYAKMCIRDSPSTDRAPRAAGGALPLPPLPIPRAPRARASRHARTGS